MPSVKATWLWLEVFANSMLEAGFSALCSVFATSDLLGRWVSQDSLETQNQEHADTIKGFVNLAYTIGGWVGQRRRSAPSHVADYEAGSLRTRKRSEVAPVQLSRRGSSLRRHWCATILEG